METDQKQEWITPQFEEIRLSSEVSSYSSAELPEELK